MFNRLIIYCPSCLEGLNKKAAEKFLSLERRKKRINYALNIPILKEELNDLVNAINSSRRSYEEKYEKLYLRTLSLSMIYNAFGENNRYFKEKFPALKKDIHDLHYIVSLESRSLQPIPVHGQFL